MGNSQISLYPTFKYNPIKLQCCMNAVTYYSNQRQSSSHLALRFQSRVVCYLDFVRAMISLFAMCLTIALIVHQKRKKRFCFSTKLKQMMLHVLLIYNLIIFIN